MKDIIIEHCNEKIDDILANKETFGTSRGNAMIEAYNEIEDFVKSSETDEPDRLSVADLAEYARQRIEDIKADGIAGKASTAMIEAYQDIISFADGKHPCELFSEYENSNNLTKLVHINDRLEEMDALFHQVCDEEAAPSDIEADKEEFTNLISRAEDLLMKYMGRVMYHTLCTPGYYD